VSLLSSTSPPESEIECTDEMDEEELELELTLVLREDMVRGWMQLCLGRVLTSFRQQRTSPTRERVNISGTVT